MLALSALTKLVPLLFGTLQVACLPTAGILVDSMGMLIADPTGILIRLEICGCDCSPVSAGCA